MFNYNKCRVCGGHDSQQLMVRYGIRHYAHADCGLERWGAEFFDKLPPYALSRFPYLPAVRKGFGEELKRRVRAIEQGGAA